MTDGEAVEALLAKHENATYTQIQSLREDLREWSRGLTKGRRMLVVTALATRTGGPAVEEFLDRLAHGSSE